MDSRDPRPYAHCIYQGPVLSFTTEAFAYPIQNVTATASSSQPNMGPEKTVDGSGLDKNDGHSTNATDMWLSAGTKPHWIQYEFDQVCTLHELWVWNSNQPVEPYAGFGAKTVKIEYSTDGTTWTPLGRRAGIRPGVGPERLHAQHHRQLRRGLGQVRQADDREGLGRMPSAGLSEVRFFYIPDRSATKP